MGADDDVSFVGDASLQTKARDVHKYMQRFGREVLPRFGPTD